MRAFRRARTRDSSLPSGEETGKENAPEPTLSESRQPSSPHLPAPCPAGKGKLSVCAGLPAAFSTVVFQQVTLQQPRHGIIAHRGGIDRQRSGRRRQRGGFDAIDRRMNGLMGELMAGMTTVPTSRHSSYLPAVRGSWAVRRMRGSPPDPPFRAAEIHKAPAKYRAPPGDTAVSALHS